MNDMNILRIIVLGIIFLFSLFVFKANVPQMASGPVSPYKIFSNESASAIGSLEIIPTSEKKAPEAKTFMSPNLDAKSVYIFDLKENEVIYEKDARIPRPLASLTKLMTALLAEEKIPEGLYVPVSINAIREDGNDGFAAGDKFKKEDLIDFMLVKSSNDAAYALAEFIGDGLAGSEGTSASKFAALMNDRARELGMLNTSFLNSNGLDIEVDKNSKISGVTGSAYDIALLMQYIYNQNPSLLSKTRNSEIKIISSGGRIIKGENTNSALDTIPQLLASKTGFTELAGGNLVYIFDAGFEHPILVSLLGSSEQGRFSDAAKIADAVLNYFISNEQ